MKQFTFFRVPLMVLALLALLAGGWAGLQRIGWHMPTLQPTLTAVHGPLMVAGALGTVISLERAVALGQRWTYIAPLLHGLGGLLLIIGMAGWPGPLLLTLGSLALVYIFITLIRRQPVAFMIVMALGAVALLVGNLLWLSGWPTFMAVYWWVGFLVLTIVGERLELGRLRRLPDWAEKLFILLVALLLSSLVVTTLFTDLGVRMMGGVLIALAYWLLRYDIARRTIRKTGLTRYIAVCLLSGYVWLAVGGLVGLLVGVAPAGPLYDAMLHAIFVGFVFAMIFGHAPIIIPAILGVPMLFARHLYAVLVLLHASLLLRIIGDVAGIGLLRRWGGMLNAVTIMVFLGTMIWAVRAAKRTDQCIHKPASLSAPR